MGTIIKYELRKIFRMRSTKVSLVAILLLTLCSGISSVKHKRYVDEIGNAVYGLKSIELKREQVTKHAGYLVILAFSSFIMVLSSKTKTSSIMVISGLLIFVPIIFRRDKENLALNRVMNLFPGNAVNAFINFSSYDTYAFKNIVLLAPQLIAILSIIGICIFIPIVFYNFTKHEVV